MALCWKWFASEDELEEPCEIVVEETEVLRPRLGNSAGSLTTTPLLLVDVTQAVDVEVRPAASAI
ncbi:hypothetical protein JCM24511_05266 [Saitozyma sp. JCM 24511]|nr:hypothetical protein JCM24511_05266 [Saitozyma sp. JCM 24511]